MLFALRGTNRNRLAPIFNKIFPSESIELTHKIPMRVLIFLLDCLSIFSSSALTRVIKLS